MTLSDSLIKKASEVLCVSINGKRVNVDIKKVLDLLSAPVPLKNEDVIYLKKDTSLEKIDILQKKLINEKEKSVLGLTISKTTKAEVIEIAKKLNEKYKKIDESSFTFDFKEIGLLVSISQENNMVEEIIIAENFGFETLKGLRIGDSIEKAVNLYGQPKMRSIVSSFWNEFSIFINNEQIKAIKIR